MRRVTGSSQRLPLHPIPFDGLRLVFQTQVRAQLGDIYVKLQRIMTVLFATSTAAPTSPLPSDAPTVKELSSLESARERARRAKEAAMAAAAQTAGFTIPPARPATEAPLSTAELCGASVAAHDRPAGEPAAGGRRCARDHRLGVRRRRFPADLVRVLAR